MLNRIGKFRRIIFWLVASLIFGQLSCSGGGSDNSNQVFPNSNIANKSNAANLNSGNSASNSTANQSGRASNAPVIVGNGNYPVYPEMSENGKTQNPDFGNNPYSINNLPSGQSSNMPPNYPGAQGQNHYPGNESPEEATIKPATPVMLDLEVAIDRWSDAEAAGYGLKMTLITLWRRRNPTVKYNPVGIDTLTSRIRERPAFANCRRAQKLSRAMFHDDGIKTVGHLYDYLEPCGGYANSDER